MSANQEPPGCKPTTHWEERCLAMEHAFQEFVIIVGQHVPEARSKILHLVADWTNRRDELREQFRTDLPGKN